MHPLALALALPLDALDPEMTLAELAVLFRVSFVRRYSLDKSELRAMNANSIPLINLHGFWFVDSTTYYEPHERVLFETLKSENSQ